MWLLFRLVDEGKELTEEELQQLLAGHHNQLSPTSASAKQPYLLYSDDVTFFLFPFLALILSIFFRFSFSSR